MSFREHMGGAMAICDHMYFLKKEIAYLEKYAEMNGPHDMGHIHTTIGVLRTRYLECKQFSDDFMKAARPLIEPLENIE